MRLSDLIAEYICSRVENAGGGIELQRVTLADMFHCAPSQINYVISTRFTPEHGYNVVSRRGGGGYIRIDRVRSHPSSLIMHAVNAIGPELDLRTAQAHIGNLLAQGAISDEVAGVLLAAIGDPVMRLLEPMRRPALRAAIVKHGLLKIIL